jgi:hypothetical protein
LYIFRNRFDAPFGGEDAMDEDAGERIRHRSTLINIDRCVGDRRHSAVPPGLTIQTDVEPGHEWPG